MPATTRSTADEFTRLVYADADFVAAEFDAIVAANFTESDVPVPPRQDPRPRKHPEPRRPRSSSGCERFAVFVDFLPPAERHAWPRAPPTGG
ncbi:MAG: hypothetical protein ACRD0P_14920 [Stackebrandtia sp.]